MIDLGVDVSAEKFVQIAIEQQAKIIACSVLLAATMSVMRDVTACANEKGIHRNVKILVGGAPITQNFCNLIGANYYASDAAYCSDLALQICAE